ncbi:replication-relaxation family protein [Actinomadura oligospora]|uniref:replication-relaxation family protein n=1 Tax=Actinomadura oligospora TaxID=111804 RepID=UPI00054D1797|nr:replication-relaxation family protein [Actinomadura oligospora]
MATLYQCRMATAEQLRRVISPSSTSTRYVRAELGKLARAGLVGAVRRRGAPRTKVWFLTRAGAVATEASPEILARPYRMTAATAAGPLQGHALAVTELLTTLEAHDHAALLDCQVEVSHGQGNAQDPTGSSSRSMVITDAVIRLQPSAVDGGVPPVLFVELDRATTSAHRLADKLHAYDRYRRHRHAASRASSPSSWRTRYPTSERWFPPVLVVITGPPQRAARRMDLVWNQLKQTYGNGLSSGEVAVAAVSHAVLLDRLARPGGLTAPIWTPLNPHAPATPVALPDLHAAARPPERT